MKIEVYISTNLHGSESTEVVEIDDDEISGLGEAAREAYIEKVAKETAFNMVEWGWNEVTT
ncbi:MAG: DUF7167 family protein [Terriglobales bacterium]